MFHRKRHGSEMRKRPPTNFVSSVAPMSLERTDCSIQPVSLKSSPRRPPRQMEIDGRTAFRSMPTHPNIHHPPRQTCRFRSLRWARSSSPVGGYPEPKHAAGDWAGAGQAREGDRKLASGCSPPYSELECKARPRPPLYSSGSGTQAGRLHLLFPSWRFRQHLDLCA